MPEPLGDLNEGRVKETRTPRPGHAVGFFFFHMAALLLSAIVLLAVFESLGVPLESDSQVVNGSLIALQALISIGAAGLFARIARLSWRETFHWRPAPRAAYVWGPAGMIALAIIIAQLGALLLRIVPELASENLVELVRLSRYTTLGSFLVYALAVSLGPGFGEEIAFRGLILAGFRSRYSPAAAVTLSALLFALMHLDPFHILLTFPAGLWMGWLVVRTGSLYPAIAAHAFNNLWSTVEAAFWQIDPRVEPLQVMMGLYPWPMVLLAAGVLLLAIHQLRGLKGPEGSSAPGRGA